MVSDSDAKLQIETPEAVSIERDLAGWPSRAGALAIDAVVLAIPAWIFIVLVVVISPRLAVVILSIGVLVGPVFYYCLFSAILGASIGKKLLGLRVVMDDGRPAGMLAIALRTLALGLDALIPAPMFSVGFICILLTKDGKRPGDFLAGTVVVRDSLRTAHAAEPFPDITYDKLMIRTVDLPAHRVRQLPADRLVLLRDFLARERSLSPGSRRAILSSLASDLAGRLGILNVQDEYAFLKEVYLCLRDERAKT